MGRRPIRGPRLPAPPILLAALYIALILAGTLLLSLPFATTQPISLFDALFSATSAVTVTGLSVVHTGSGFTLFGQAVILLLIQIGGVGLMTFAVLLLSSLGVRISTPSRQVLREDLSQSTMHELMDLAVSVVRISLIVELAGMAVLALVFVPDFGWVRGMWYALFHAVSAFNNAGFGLRQDSLAHWATDPVINLAIPALFITGGLGFVVIGDMLEKRRWRLLSLHSKLMLMGTVGLTLYGMVAFAALEWRNPGTLGAFDSTGAKLAASWFQSLTTRTAGFSTVEIANLHDSTSLVMIALMLVGGGSASTAGGIKVTTLIVALLATIAFFQQTSPRAFGRRIGQDQVLKVMALTTIATLTVLTGLFLVSVAHDDEFLDLAFEVASAFGTVGLSRGATGTLDGLGQGVTIVLMFLGRVGPLTLGYLLATPRASRVKFPEGRVYLG